MTGALDRFSRYATPDAARDQRAARDGFGGIGVTLDTVPRPFPHHQGDAGQGPPICAGIRARRPIVAIDGRPTAGRSRSEVIRLLRGPVFSSVVDRRRSRREQPKPAITSLQRTLIVAPTVTLARDGGIAIFHISSFNQNTTQQLVDDLDSGRARRRARSCAASCSICAAIPAGCSTRRSASPTCSSPRGRSSRRSGGNPASHQYFAASGDSIAPTSAARRAGQWRLGLGLGDRRRGAAGCRARGGRRHRLLRQGHGADRAAAAQ